MKLTIPTGHDQMFDWVANKTATNPVMVPKNSTTLILYPQISTNTLLMLKKSVIFWR